MTEALPPLPRAATLSKWHERVLADRFERRVETRHIGTYATMYLHPRAVEEMGVRVVRKLAARLRAEVHGYWADDYPGVEPGRVRFHLERDVDGPFEELIILSAVLLPAGESLVDPKAAASARRNVDGVSGS